MSNSPHTRDVQLFIQTLFLSDDIVELRSIWPIKSVKSVRQDWCRADEIWSPDKLALLAGFNAEGFGIYLGVNPRRRHGGAKDADVLLARALFVDFDGGCTVDEATTRIQQAGLPEPTVVVNSGHGVHAYWRLLDPVPDMRRFRDHQRGLIQALGSDPAVSDPSRVMRLPGFLNTKDPPAPCVLVTCQPDRAYDLARFPIPAVAEPARPAIKSSTTTRYGDRALEAEVTRVLRAPVGERNSTLVRAAFRIGQLVAAGHHEEASAFAALVRAGVGSGLSEPEAKDAVQRAMAKGASSPREGVPQAAPRTGGSAFGTSAVQAAPPHQDSVTVTPAAYVPFPIRALPVSMRDYIVQTARGMDADPVFIATPALAIFAAAIGTSARIVVKPGWTEPSCLWTGLVALPGSLKSQTQEAAAMPCNEAQRGADMEFGADLAEYRKAKEAHDAAKKANRAGKVTPSISEPEVPQRTQFITQDVTAEALVVVLSHNTRGVVNIWDELGGFFGGFARYSSGSNAGEPSAAFYKSAYTGRPHTENRKGPDGKGRYVRLECPLVSVTGTIQPEALKRILRRQYIEDGLASRFLWVMPPDRAGGWVEVDQGDDSAARKYSAVYQRLLGIPVRTDLVTGAPEPVRICLSAEARVVAKDWVTSTQYEVMRASDPAIRAAWAKLKGGAFRIALVLHLVEWAERGRGDFGTVSADTMRRAVEIARWFGREAERVYEMLGESETDRESREVLDWVRKQGGRVTASELAHGLRRFRNNSQAAEAALNELVQAGWGGWEQVQHPSGGRPKTLFVMASADTVTETSPDPADSGGFSDSDAKGGVK